MRGEPYLMRILGFGFRGPKNRVPGLDVAGTVAAVGGDVSRFKVGDEVFGISRGSFAEYAAAREDKLVRKPAGLSFEQAAVVAVSGLAALQALRAGRIAARQKVYRRRRRRQVDRSRAAAPGAHALAGGATAADHVHLRAPAG
jgi:NADPH:quinone reductase-like Zn-dependent oxidoreductase